MNVQHLRANLDEAPKEKARQFPAGLFVYQ
jgi:hypothetical protein